MDKEYTSISCRRYSNIAKRLTGVKNMNTRVDSSIPNPNITEAIVTNEMKYEINTTFQGRLFIIFERIVGKIKSSTMISSGAFNNVTGLKYLSVSIA